MIDCLVDSKAKERRHARATGRINRLQNGVLRTDLPIGDQHDYRIAILTTLVFVQRDALDNRLLQFRATA